MSDENPGALAVGAGCFLFLVMFGLFHTAITWAAVWVFYLFGVEVPFWPTFGAVFVLEMVFGIVGRR